jgi:hypothetical protein
VFVDETRHDPADGVALFAGRGEVYPQHLVDPRLHRVQPWRVPYRFFPRCGHRGVDGLAHCSAVDSVAFGQLSDGVVLSGIPADRLEQHQSRIGHEGPPDYGAVIVASPGRWGQFKPPLWGKVTQVGPSQAAQTGASSNRHCDTRSHDASGLVGRRSG